MTDAIPARLIADRAYDSDQLDYRLAAEYGIELIDIARVFYHKKLVD